MTIQQVFRGMARLFRRERFAADLDEEMRLHMELRARKLRDAGVAAEEADNAARRRFGNQALLHEVSTEVWGWTGWEHGVRDVHYAFRALRKTPGFTSVAVCTLAVGLGMNTAVFSIVNAVMIRKLPFAHPDELVAVWPRNTTGKGGDSPHNVAAPADLAYWQQAAAFSGIAGFADVQMNLTGLGAPARIPGDAVTWNFFSVLGVQPERGRAILPDEDRPGGNLVTVISYEFWQSRLGGDPNVLHRAIMLDGSSYQIVGILPPGFQSPDQFGKQDPIEYYVPAAYSKELLASHGDFEIRVVGRLKAGNSIHTAQSQLDAISVSLGRQFAEERNFRATLTPLSDSVVWGFKDSLVALLGAAGLIVLITCVNVANLLLVRAVSRRHETSVRFALGAGRLRIVRQFLAESLIVAVAGCAAGLLLGTGIMRLLVSIAPAEIPRIGSVTMDWRVFGMATILATLTGIAFGLAPAWQASRTNPSESMKASGRNPGGPSQARWRQALTVAELALSTILLIGAGLLLNSFVRLMKVDLGFQPERVLAMAVNLPETRYRTGGQRLQFFQELEQRVSSLPGVQAAAFANRFPLRHGWGSGVIVDTAPEALGVSDFQAVSTGYFDTLRIALLGGRWFTAQDRAGEPPVAIVNQAFARAKFPNQEAIGHRLRRGSNAPWVSIAGVVSDIRRDGKSADVAPEVYLPAAQTNLYPVRLSDLAVRTAGDPRRLLTAIQRQIWAIDKDQPVTNVRTMEEIISSSAAQRSFEALLLALFAAVAVGLAIIGIYGVLSYMVRQRTAELGMRVALGARPLDILRLVLQQASIMIAGGIALGLAGAYVLSRYLETLLFHVRRDDGGTYLGCVALLSAVSVLASLIPARRGARIDPIVALRYE